MTDHTHELTLVGLFDHPDEGRGSFVQIIPISLVRIVEDDRLDNAGDIQAECDTFINGYAVDGYTCISLSHSLEPLPK